MQPMAERLGVDEQGLRKKTFGKKAEADRFAATVEADKHRGQYVDHADRTTVTEYARAWAAARPPPASPAARGGAPAAPGEHCRPGVEPHRRPHRRHAARAASSRRRPPVGGAGVGDRP